mmetsp:Transcript_98672/g.185420  ORF Transcript_98672/g.185420 Transcript_98672/m.185420 type:complete len:83 (-) Transcript_98672:76-324(-)
MQLAAGRTSAVPVVVAAAVAHAAVAEDGPAAERNLAVAAELAAEPVAEQRKQLAAAVGLAEPAAEPAAGPDAGPAAGLAAEQ